jgi:hypothetical protein
VLHLKTGSGTRVIATRRGILGVKAGDLLRFALDDAYTHIFDAGGKMLESKRSWREDYLSAI